MQCIFQAPAPPRRKKRKPTESDLIERLRQYEETLKQHGIDAPDSLAQDEFRNTPETHERHATKPRAAEIGHPDYKADLTNVGTLIGGGGRSRYIDSNLWKALSNEVQEHIVGQPSEMFQSSDDELEPGDDGPTPVNSLDGARLLFGGPKTPQNALDLHPLHPSPAVGMKLWEAYRENVEPLVKLMHVPTVHHRLLKAFSDLHAITRATECMLFAIYHFSIVSMTAEEAERITGERRLDSMKKFHHGMCAANAYSKQSKVDLSPKKGLQQALVNAGFLKTTEIAVLQAYVLFLLSVRNRCDPHTFWALTGIAVRIAQRMGLHRDGEVLGLKPFDTELRRRLFWQIVPLDGRASQVAGVGKYRVPSSEMIRLHGHFTSLQGSPFHTSRNRLFNLDSSMSISADTQLGIAIPSDTWDVKAPLNLNDTDIYPDMSTTPAERAGATDMLFCLLRAEVGRRHQKAHWSRPSTASDYHWYTNGGSEKEAAINELENLLEGKFLRYCDVVDPLHFLALGMARSAVASMRLRARHPRHRSDAATMSAAEKEDVFNLALRIIDYDNAAWANSETNKFRWHTQAFFQWDALVYVLNELQHLDPSASQTGKAWSKVSEVYKHHKELLTQRRALHVAVGRLTLKAWQVYWSFMEHNSLEPEEPGYITSLRSMHGDPTIPPGKGRSVPASVVVKSQELSTPDSSDLQKWTNVTSTDDTSLAQDMTFGMDFDFNIMDWGTWDELIRDYETNPVQPN